jgi:RNA polymerase sigma-70 factor (ECF subfamily)
MELVKIAYQFADGHVEEMEVEKEIANAIKELESNERRNTRRETRRHESLSDLDFEGEIFVDPRSDTAHDAIRRLDLEMLRNALLTLTPEQQDLIRKAIYIEKPLSEIAHLEGVDKSAITHRIERIYRRLKKILV